jgi:hypothetical protein
MQPAQVDRGVLLHQSLLLALGHSDIDQGVA